MKKVIIFGHTGMLGKSVTEKLRKNFSVIGKSFDDDGFDLTKETQVASFLKEEKPFAVVNCAAFTDVDACETESGYRSAFKINAEVPGMLAGFCKHSNINFIHISTDYVFNDNSKSGYDEAYMNFDPMNSYGETKLLGEQAVIESANGLRGSDLNQENPRVFVLRTQWLFGEGGKNFVTKITQLAREKKELEVVDDEYGCPTYVRDLSGSVEFLLTEQPKSGIYHGVSSNACSRYEFAKQVLNLQNISVILRPTKLSEYKRMAHIAQYSILKNTKFKTQRTWQEMLADFIDHGKS